MWKLTRHTGVKNKPQNVCKDAVHMSKRHYFSIAEPSVHVRLNGDFITDHITVHLISAHKSISMFNKLLPQVRKMRVCDISPQ